MVADAATTAAAQAATAGTRSTVRTGTVSRAARADGRSNHMNAIAPTMARAATNRNGRRMPPASYSQPPSVGPNMNAEARARHHEAHHAAALLLAVEIGDQREADDPRDRVGGALHQARGEQPRQALGEREDRRAAASASSPPTIGSLRPMRSETAPIGIDTASSVTPNEANSSPIIVGDAPSRRAQIRQHRHGDRVGGDVGEGREGDERDGDRARATDGHSQ